MRHEKTGVDANAVVPVLNEWATFGEELDVRPDPDYVQFAGDGDRFPAIPRELLPALIAYLQAVDRMLPHA